MFKELKSKRSWSDVGLATLLIAIAGAVLLAVADALLRATGREDATILTLVIDLRYVFENLMVPAAIVFVGGKFLEA